MTDDITKNLSDSAKLNFIINAVSDTNRRLSALEERVEARLLEERVEARLHDTRPIWENVQRQLDEIRAHKQRHDEQLVDLRQRQDEGFAQLRFDLRKVEKQLGLIHQDNLAGRAEMGFLEDRLNKLEKAA